MTRDDHLIFEAFKNKGLSDYEYHKARKDAFEGAGEEVGKGPIKVVLKHNTTLDCYKAGTVQGVRFVKGTIFNCDVNVGDYYECDTEEYGGIAVFPDDVKVLKDSSEGKEEDSEDSAEDKMKDRENERDEKQRDAEVANKGDGLKYTYEIVAYLPRDIDISTREGQDKVLSLAHKEIVKIITHNHKNPERAASNMFYDEDFPMELVSQYSHYQRHGFPDVGSEDEETPHSVLSKVTSKLLQIKRKLEINKEHGDLKSFSSDEILKDVIDSLNILDNK